MSTRRPVPRRVFKVIFQSQGRVYEIYARQVTHGQIFGFVEVEQLLFGERSQVVVDPSEESLKAEFSGVHRTFLPLHAVLRIDEVEKEGPARVTAAEKASGTVAPFPTLLPTGGKPPVKS